MSMHVLLYIYNVSEKILNGDIGMNNGWWIHSNELFNRAPNYSNTYKVNIKCYSKVGNNIFVI